MNVQKQNKRVIFVLSSVLFFVLLFTCVYAVAPSAPSLNSPVLGSIVAAPNVTLNVTVTDEDSSTLNITFLQTGNAISKGISSGCGILANGSVMCWGYNVLNGEVGDGTTTQRNNPVFINSSNTFTALSVLVSQGNPSACGITSNGTAMCWGDNIYGKLGDGTQTTRPNPRSVNISNLFSAISHGGSHTCGVLTTGRMVCWGYNQNGQVGDGSTTTRTNPVYVNNSNIFIGVSTGGTSSCSLLANGSAMCWGTNSNGRLGDGTTTDRYNPVFVNTSKLFISIAVGGSHACGLLANGSVMCWGLNTDGQVGDGTTTQRTNPIFINSSNQFSAIAAGYVHTCGIILNGSAMCWGNGANGEIGDGYQSDRTNPSFVNSSNTFVSITAGYDTSCGIIANGSAMCWGKGTYGSLGYGGTSTQKNPILVNTTNPFRLDIIGTINDTGNGTAVDANWTGLSPAVMYPWRVKVSDGSSITYSPLWYFTTIDTTLPVFTGIANQTVELATTWNYTINATDVVGISCFSINDTTNFQINCTGFLQNKSGLSRELYTINVSVNDTHGNNQSIEMLINVTDTRSPTFTVIANQTIAWQIALGYQINATDASGIDCFWVNDTTNFKINCTGYLENNTYLPDATYWLNISVNDTIGNNKSAVMWVKVTDTTLPTITLNSPANGSSIALNPILNATVTDNDNDTMVVKFWTGAGEKLCGGGTYACGILSNGTAFCWGNGASGVLGTGLNGTSYNINKNPLAVNTSNLFSSISCSRISTGMTCGLLLNGTAMCWGNSVGDGTSLLRPNPVYVNTTGKFIAISAGVQIACGILFNNSVLCWGGNSYGEVGDGTTTQRWTPVPINTSNTFKAISSAGYAWASFTCGITINGSVMCWGENSFGQLGDGTTTYRKSPTFINSSAQFISISAGEYHTCGVLINGSALCWGRNNKGQLGDGTTTQRNNPVFINTSALFTAIFAGGYDTGNEHHSCGLLTNGSLLCWGSNTWGQIGDGTTTQRLNPVFVNTSNNFASITLGETSSYGILSNGSAMCWGGAGNGQLGDGSTTSRSNPVYVNLTGFMTPIIGNVSNVANGTSATFNWTGLRELVTYLWSATASDGNFLTMSTTWSFTTLDTTPPNFTNLINHTIEFGNGLNYDINATDSASDVKCFKVNDTVNFKISCAGILENNTGLIVNVYLVSITANDTYDNNNTQQIVINVSDTIAPTINITYPLNNTNYTVNVSMLNYTATDVSNLDKCWYSNSSGVWNSTLVAARNNFTDVMSIENWNNWTVYCNDSSGNIGNSTMRTFYKDTTSPIVAIIYPINNTNHNSNISMLNYTVSDASALDKCWYSNSSGIWNSTAVTAGDNFTSVMSYENWNNWTVCCNDTFGFIGSSSLLEFYKDTVAPAVVITYPLNNTDYIVNVSMLNYTVSDASVLDKCWYSNSSGIWNSTAVTAGDNFTSVVSYEGWNNWTIYCNDTITNLGVSAIREFYKDTVLPSFTDFTNQTIAYNSSLAYDINATDFSGVSCFTVNDTTNFRINCTGYLENKTLLNVQLYELNISINDTKTNTYSAVMWVNVTDTVLPASVLNSPADNYVNDSTNLTTVTFNCSATDNYNIANISLYITNSSNMSFTSNQTTIITGISNVSEWTLNLTTGNYTWNCLVYDYSGNSNWSLGNRTYAVTDLPVNLSFVNPTPKSGETMMLQNYFLANITFSGNNATIYVYNATNNLIRTYWSGTSPFFVNLTNLTEGVYYFNATANSVTRINRTSTRSILISPDGLGFHVLNNTKISDGIGGFYPSGLTGGTSNGDMFGSSVANIGDLNGDGVQDLVVGAFNDEAAFDYNEGAIYILFMNRNGTVQSNLKISDNLSGFYPSNLNGSDRFGYSVANIGDLDDDGVTDLAVGADLDEATTDNLEGAVYILFLNSTGGVKSNVKISDGLAGFNPTNLQGGTLWGDTFGSSVTSIGDLDGDGVQDLAVGAMDTNATKTTPDWIEGSIYILFMNSTGGVKNHTWIQNLTGLRIGEDDNYLGASLAGIGDLDKDGIPDIAAGGPGDSEGAIYIMFMNRNGTVRNNTKIANNISGFNPENISATASFGRSITNMGDLNGDGVQDLIVGAPGDKNLEYSEGAVYILLLNTDGTVSSNTKIADGLKLFYPENLNASDMFGYSVANIGDLNGDGVQDLASGAYYDQATNNASDKYEGALYILFLGVENTPPILNITSPANYTFVNGNVTLNASATDNLEVRDVIFRYKNATGQFVQLCNATVSPYTCMWETANYSASAEGYDINVTAFDTSNNNAPQIIHLTIDRSTPQIHNKEITYPLGQSAVRNTQQIILTVNISDSGSAGAGINTTKIDLTALNATGNVTMNLESGVLSFNNWSLWNITVIINTSATGYIFSAIYLYDNATPLNALNNTESFNVFVDNQAPVFTVIENQTIEYPALLNYTINATDSSGVSCFSVNDTTNFRINCTGYLENMTLLTPKVYHLNITVNDIIGNNHSAAVWVNVTSTGPAITIVSPMHNHSYTTNVNALNYNVTSVATVGMCWYSNSSGAWNSTIALGGNNFTSVVSVEGSNTWTVYCNDTGNNTGSSSVIFYKDTVIPVFTAMVDRNVEFTSLFDYDINATDVNGISCFGVNDSTNFKINCTGTIENKTQLAVGVYQLNITVNDTYGNSNSAIMRVNVSDTVAPAINFTAQTDTSSAIVNRTYIIVNVTASDAALKNITTYVYNSSNGLVNATFSSSSPLFVNFTNLQDGGYYFNVTAVDNSSNLNRTETRNITLDTTAPNLRIVSPRNNSFTNSDLLDVLYNLTDLTVPSCWFSNDSMTSNTTLDNCANITTIMWSSGQHNITVWANDSVGHINSSSISFVVDMTPPNVTLQSPAGGYWNDTTSPINVSFNCSAEDNYNLSRIQLYITNATNQSFSLNQSTVVYGIGNYSNWTVSVSTGNYTWGCLAIDSANNLNWSVSNRSLLINFSDEDSDGIADEVDSLEGNESNVNSTGILHLNITIGGNKAEGTFNNTQNVVFYDASVKLLNFTHNFSVSDLDLSKVTIVKLTDAIIINLSGQLQANKTVYIEDNNFVNLCVKDAEIASISEITAGCTGENETDFTLCLGSSLTRNRISCTDLGASLQFDNMQHSAVRGTPSSSPSPAASAVSASASSSTFVIPSQKVNKSFEEILAETNKKTEIVVEIPTQVTAEITEEIISAGKNIVLTSSTKISSLMRVYAFFIFGIIAVISAIGIIKINRKNKTPAPRFELEKPFGNLISSQAEYQIVPHWQYIKKIRSLLKKFHKKLYKSTHFQHCHGKQRKSKNNV